jgi:hypothetical protein
MLRLWKVLNTKQVTEKFLEDTNIYEQRCNRCSIHISTITENVII